MNKIRVMIIEDSAVIRELLQFIIGSDARLEVAVAVDSAEEALRVLHQVSPDVISMDIQLPGMNGLDATRRIMSVRPTPIVVIAGSAASEETKTSINALRAGALAVLDKPAGFMNGEYEAAAERICTQLVIMSQVKVVRRRIDTESSSAALMKPVPRLVPGPVRNGGHYDALGIVASTGGPNAVVQVLTGLGADFPLPILLTQHITRCFLEGFISWLSGVSPFQVVIARHNEVPAAGKVYLAAEDKHLRLDNGVLKLDASPPVSFQRPSGTLLFQSMAESLGKRAFGVLLTGMGDDGALGLLAIRQCGGYTIAEDETTAVVYGMPAEAARFECRL